MIEFLAKVVVFQWIADRLWVLLAVVPVVVLWVAGRRVEARELRAKRQEAVVLFGRLRDRRAERERGAQERG